MASGAKKAARQDSSVTMPLSMTAAATAALPAASAAGSAASASAGSALMSMATGSPLSFHPKPSHWSSVGLLCTYSAVPEGTKSEVSNCARVLRNRGQRKHLSCCSRQTFGRGSISMSFRSTSQQRECPDLVASCHCCLSDGLCITWPTPQRSLYECQSQRRQPMARTGSYHFRQRGRQDRP